MNFLNIGNLVDVSIMLLEGIVAKTASPLDDLGLAAIKRAIAELRKVRGTPITKAQVDSFRVEQTF